MPKKTNYVYAVGRRKEAVARVRLFAGKGENTVNGVSIEKYFSGEIAKEVYLLPFRVIDAEKSFFVSAKVLGGGKESQLQAVSSGIAKTLAKAKADFRSPLKKLGLLTRDARIRQRRMVGMGGKSRRKRQSPKR